MGRVTRASSQQSTARAMAGHFPGLPAVRQDTRASAPSPMSPGTVSSGPKFPSIEAVKKK